MNLLAQLIQWCNLVGSHLFLPLSVLIEAVAIPEKYCSMFQVKSTLDIYCTR